jgi:hypothetical protein
MFRVIFLDIDGVLNSRAWWRRRPSKEHRPHNELDPEAVARVQRLVDETGASIVISSTWRLLYKRLVLQSLLSAKGLRTRISGVTPALRSGPRGLEIQRWLDTANLMPEAHRPQSIVILDDDSDMEHLAPWHVKTHIDRGLTDWEVERAKEVLTRPAPPVRRSGAA